MTELRPIRPERYAPSTETRAPDEAETTARLTKAMRDVQRTTFEDYGHALRAVHAKSHGLIEGEMEVLGGLPEALAQGLFARPATYPVVMRLSTNPGDVLDDAISAPRGMAIKVIGVEGQRLPGSEGDRTQDFVMVDAPAFSAPDPAAFARSLTLLSATTDTGQGWKKAFSAALRGAEAAIEAAGGESATLTTLGGQAPTHPLGETFYTQTPFRHGDHVAKLSLAPVSPALRALADRPVEVRGRPNALREEVIGFLRDHDAEWELRVQLRTDPDAMPIEDASVAWPEDRSPYVAVARIRAPRQPAWSEARARQVDDGLAFSPWHGIEAHRPLGGINRSRKEAYASAAAFRSERNRCPIAEPARAVDLAREPAQPYGTAPGREGRRPGTPDARRSAWGRERGQPMGATLRHAAAGAAGGLAAGLLLSAAIAGMGAAQGKASELVALERRAARRAGRPPRRGDAPGTAGEEAISHGGHLALSALAGAGYGAASGRDASPAAAGLAFGAAFWALAYGVVGPALGVTPKPWRDSPSSLAQHGILHAVFGVATALATDRLVRVGAIRTAPPNRPVDRRRRLAPEPRSQVPLRLRRRGACSPSGSNPHGATGGAAGPSGSCQAASMIRGDVGRPVGAHAGDGGVALARREAHACGLAAPRRQLAIVRATSSDARAIRTCFGSLRPAPDGVRRDRPARPRPGPPPVRPVADARGRATVLLRPRASGTGPGLAPRQRMDGGDAGGSGRPPRALTVSLHPGAHPAPPGRRPHHPSSAGGRRTRPSRVRWRRPCPALEPDARGRLRAIRGRGAEAPGAVSPRPSPSGWHGTEARDGRPILDATEPRAVGNGRGRGVFARHRTAAFSIAASATAGGSRMSYRVHLRSRPLAASLAAALMGAAPAGAAPVLFALGDSVTFGEDDLVYEPVPGDRGYVSRLADLLARDGSPRPIVRNFAIDGETAESFGDGTGRTPPVVGRTDDILALQNTSYDEAGGIETQQGKFLDAVAAERAMGNAIEAVTITLGFNELAALATMSTDEALAAIPETLDAYEESYADVLSTIRGAAPEAALYLPAYYNPFPADPDSPAAPIFFEAGSELNAIIEDLAGEFGGTYIDGVPDRFVGREEAFTFLDDQPAGFVLSEGPFGGELPIGNVHATEAGYEAIAAAFRDEIAPIPVPAALPLSLGAMAVLGALGLRRRR